MPTKKRTSTKPQSAAKKPAPKPLAISREHPAFMLFGMVGDFPTKPVQRTWQRLLDAMRSGDKADEELAVESLKLMLSMPPPAEWLDKTGLPPPCNIKQMQERMAAAGFSPETIISGEWTPYRVSPVILGKGRIPKTQEEVVNLHGNLPPPHIEDIGPEERALALLVRHPGWSQVDMAKAVGVYRTTLYRFKRYQAAREVLQGGQADIPRGFKDSDGTLEAWDSDTLGDTDD